MTCTPRTEGRAMAVPVSEVGCPTCGAALGPYELFCPSCGSKLRHFAPVENLPPRQRELHDIANGAIAQATAHIANARRLNAGRAEHVGERAEHQRRGRR